MGATHNNFNEIINSISPKQRDSKAREATISPIVASVIGHALGIDEQIVHAVSNFADHEVRERPIRSMAVATGAGLALGAALAFRWRVKQNYRTRYL